MDESAMDEAIARSRQRVAIAALINAALESAIAHHISVSDACYVELSNRLQVQ
ncbi:MAG: hypothetical protein AAF773_07090 [Cyanobacteria bacterium P01_D01_bin.115]